MGNNIPVNTFKLDDLFEQIYGFIPAHVPTVPAVHQSAQAKVNSTFVQRPTTIKGSPLYGLSDTLGRQVFCPVSFIAGDTRYDFPYAIVGMKSKILTKQTPMIERGGVTIEEIGAGPWELSVKGFLIDPNNDFPDEQIDLLNQLYSYRNPVSMICALSDMVLEISDQVVIVDLQIPPKPKVIGVRDFEMTVLQDSILDLYSVE